MHALTQLTKSFQGNDPEEDSDREPEPPTRAVEKPLPRSTKRDAPDVPHARGSGGEGRGRGGRGGRGGGRGGGREDGGPSVLVSYSHNKPIKFTPELF